MHVKGKLLFWLQNPIITQKMDAALMGVNDKNYQLL